MPRHEVLRVRLGRDELAVLDALVVERGTTRSEVVRELIQQAGPPPAPPTLAELLEPFADDTAMPPVA